MHSKITRDLPPWVRSCNRFAAAVYTVARHNNGAILFPIYGVSECLWNRRAGRFSGKAVAFRDVAAFRSRSCVCDKLSTLYCLSVKNTFFHIKSVHLSEYCWKHALLATPEKRASDLGVQAVVFCCVWRWFSSANIEMWLLWSTIVYCTYCDTPTYTFSK